MISSFLLLPFFVSAVLGGRANATRPVRSCKGVEAISPQCPSSEAPYTRDFFYVGGRYITGSTGNITADQLYVEKLTPVRGVSQPKPLVFFHGGGASGVTWLNTPDNRKGFASYFIEKGHQVYLVDHVAVGRSTEMDQQNFPLSALISAELVEAGFTDVEAYEAYPQARLHTQWPGSGTKGDPTFDAFVKSMTSYTSNLTAQELAMRASGCTLLSLIGPSYLLSHSIGSLFPTLLSNDCPTLVAGNINLEGSNVPFQSYTVTLGATSARPWGLTTTPIDYHPPITDPTQLQTVLVGNATQTLAKRACVMQVEPARKLPKIASVPYLMLTGQASVHMAWDHCLVAYMKQVGGNPEWIKLADRGILGNGHFGHVELNNLKIAALVEEWIEAREGKSGGKKGGGRQLDLV